MIQRMEGKGRKRVVSTEEKGSAKGLSRIQVMGKKHTESESCLSSYVLPDVE